MGERTPSRQEQFDFSRNAVEGRKTRPYISTVYEISYHGAAASGGMMRPNGRTISSSIWMLEHPVLINRPVVVTPAGVKLCRPSEAVLDILPAPQRGVFVKEHGELVVDDQGRRVAGAGAGG